MRDNQVPEVNPEYVIEKFDNEILLYTEVGAKAVYLTRHSRNQKGVKLFYHD